MCPIRVLVCFDLYFSEGIDFNWIFFNRVDIVDIKPINMEELTEVITAAEFHPHQCNLLAYSSSKGSIKLNDMRQSALCDNYSKGTVVNSSI